jgi:hypothetical protein
VGKEYGEIESEIQGVLKKCSLLLYKWLISNF